MPMIRGGIQFSIFGKNPSDANTYMTLAETLRTAEWDKLLKGGNLGDKVGMAQLVDESPTALYSARFIAKKSMRLASMLSLSWYAEITHTPVYKAYYAFSLLSFLVCIPLILYMGKSLRLSPILNYGSLSAFIVGYWPQALLDHDCLSQINFLPILFLSLLGLWHKEYESSKIITSSRFLVSLCLAATITYYTEFLLFWITCLVVYYIIEWWKGGQRIVRILQEFAVIIVTALAILLLTGQLDYYFRTIWMPIAFAAKSHNIGGPVLFEPYLKFNPIAAFWGLPDFFALLKAKWSGLQSPLNALYVLPLALSLFLSLVIISILRKPLDGRHRILVSFWIGALASFSFVTVTTKEVYLMGKTLYFVALPFSVLLLLLAPNYLNLNMISRSPKYGRILKTVVTGVILLWLSTQMLSGVLRYVNVDMLRSEHKQSNYDIQPVLNYLRTIQPKKLAVNIPSDTEWPFALYSMFAFSEFKPFFQSGIIYDNNNDRVFIDLQKNDILPDYLVIRNDLRNHYLSQLEAVIETKELTLYRVVSARLEDFQI